MLWIFLQSFSFTPLTASEEMIFKYIFLQIYHFCCHGNQSNSEVWTKFRCLVEDYSRNISVKLLSIICNEIAINDYFHVSHYKSMETLSCHSNESTWATAIKTHNFYRAFLQSFMFIPLIASEEKSFEYVLANLSFRVPWLLDFGVHNRSTHYPCVYQVQLSGFSIFGWWRSPFCLLRVLRGFSIFGWWCSPFCLLRVLRFSAYSVCWGV